jgi:hypothetical protein
MELDQPTPVSHPPSLEGTHTPHGIPTHQSPFTPQPAFAPCVRHVVCGHHPREEVGEAEEESANSSAPRAAREKLLADLKSTRNFAY